MSADAAAVAAGRIGAGGRRAGRGHRVGTLLRGLGLAILPAYALIALLGPLLAPADPLAQDYTNLLAAPGAEHLFGTDNLGRDVFSRWLYGTRIDLQLAVVATVLSLLLGVTVGLLSGYAGGWVDSLFNRITDVFQTLPAIVLLIVLLLIFGSSRAGIVIAMVATSWVAYARLVRSVTLVVCSRDYVLAAQLAGFGHLRVLRRHVLPNVWLQAFVYMTSDLIGAIVAVASLGYLGIGIQPPTPEWGQMIADGQAYLRTAPWLTVIPGVMVVVLGLGLALASDALAGRLRGAR